MQQKIIRAQGCLALKVPKKVHDLARHLNGCWRKFYELPVSEKRKFLIEDCIGYEYKKTDISTEETFSFTHGPYPPRRYSKIVNELVITSADLLFEIASHMIPVFKKVSDCSGVDFDLNMSSCKNDWILMCKHYLPKSLSEIEASELFFDGEVYGKGLVVKIFEDGVSSQFSDDNIEWEFVGFPEDCLGIYGTSIFKEKEDAIRELFVKYRRMFSNPKLEVSGRTSIVAFIPFEAFLLKKKIAA